MEANFIAKQDTLNTRVKVNELRVSWFTFNEH